jgi:N6-adenosine-specific RNA methylase IME4
MKFSCIVADPPWRVSAGRSIGIYEMRDGRQLFGVSNNAARRTAYPSMSVDQIAALRVPAADAAHLYLWTINRYVEDAYRVARAWGFAPSTLLTWAKTTMGGGLGGDAYGLSSEFCLFARRGSLPADERISASWWQWKRPYRNGAPRHSAKPPEFYAMVERVSPGPRLEMFAREQRDGWSVWGNEVPSDVQITEATPAAPHQAESCSESAQLQPGPTPQ